MKKKKKLGLAAFLLSAGISIASIGSCSYIQPNSKSLEISSIVPETGEVLYLREKLEDIYSNNDFVKNYDSLVKKQKNYEERLNNLMKRPEVVDALREIKYYDRMNFWLMLGGFEGAIIAGLCCSILQD